MLDVGIRGSLLTCEAKTKALISYAVTKLLICVFVSTHAKSRYCHNVVHIYYTACKTELPFKHAATVL